MKSVNPATGEIVWEGGEATLREIDDAVLCARKAFNSWSLVPLKERIALLKTFQNELQNHQTVLARAISEETGKPLWESHGEVGAMIGKVDISIDAYNTRSGERLLELPAATSITRHKPHGVLAVFGPYNFPAHLPNGHIVPALLAGNAIVFKPSEQTPLVAEVMLDLWNRSHLPKGVLNLVFGGKRVGKALVDHPGIDGLLFTGSFPTGQLLAKHFANHPGKILALEMGGNNPLVIGEVEDLEAAAYHTIQSAFITSGQRCTCARRLIVPRGTLGDQFIEKLLAMMETIVMGPYTDLPEPFLGPLISRKAAKMMIQAQKSMIEKGACSLVPMELQKHAFITPGLIDTTHIAQRDDCEHFGPLLQLIRVENFKSAVQEANNTSYGLAAGLLSDQPKEYQQFFQEIRAGIVNWNCPTTGASSAAPFGGIGQSGNHRPSAYYAADYCAYPVASLESQKLTLPEKLSAGVSRCPK